MSQWRYNVQLSIYVKKHSVYCTLVVLLRMQLKPGNVAMLSTKYRNKCISNHFIEPLAVHLQDSCELRGSAFNTRIGVLLHCRSNSLFGLVDILGRTFYHWPYAYKRTQGN